jgi:hypothetical protein
MSPRDDASGWWIRQRLTGGLPFDFENPPVTAKVVWNVVDETAFPRRVRGGWSAGGWAFDSTGIISLGS